MSETVDTSGYLDMDLLRFTTAGSVDDGKSTLIGRLLFDSKAIFEDQMDAIEATSKRKGQDDVDLSLLTDGLKDEREQGITIDVAYRYFATPKRKFIIADTPGHIEYTRNMVTGASTADLAIILVDARHGVIEQTKRHSFIASLLQIKHLVVCVNKMDLVDYGEEAFDKIRNDFNDFASRLDVPDIRFIPISALKGDNVVDKSEKMDWYQGSTLLYTLETVKLGADLNHVDARFPVQYVIRPQIDEFRDYRGYAGRVAGGVFKPGDEVMVLPTKTKSKIKSIDTFDGSIEEAFTPMSVTITLEDDINISRGDMIVKPLNKPDMVKSVEVMVCWMSDSPIDLDSEYFIKHTSNQVKGEISDIRYKVDINNLRKIEGDQTVSKNDIVRLNINLFKPLFVDDYKKNRATGSLILVDEFTNETVAAGMVL